MSGVETMLYGSEDRCDIRLGARIGTIMMCNKKSSGKPSPEEQRQCDVRGGIEKAGVHGEDIMP